MADYNDDLVKALLGNSMRVERGGNAMAPLGFSPSNPGEISDPDQARYLRQLIAQDPSMVGNPNALGMGAGLGLAAAPWLKFLPMPWPLKLLGTAAGAGISYMGGKGLWGDMDTMDKAIQAKRELPAFEKQDKR